MPHTLIPAAWDIISALANAKNLGTLIGGGLLSLFGIIGVVTAVVFFFVKLLSENSRRSWITIVVLFLLGGIALTGGIALFVNMASGAQTTINQLGGGTILLGQGLASLGIG